MIFSFNKKKVSVQIKYDVQLPYKKIDANLRLKYWFLSISFWICEINNRFTYGDKHYCLPHETNGTNLFLD